MVVTAVLLSVVSSQFVENHRRNDQPTIRVAALRKQLNLDNSDDRNPNIDRLLQPQPAPTPNKDDLSSNSDAESTRHSRQKRMIWITDDGRLALPPGTVLSISPTISLPLVRYPPSGFLSNLTMSFPLTSKLQCLKINCIKIIKFIFRSTVDFDKLGLTDNENPLGVLPPVFGRSMGRAAGSMLAHYVGEYLHTRRKRDVSSQQSGSSSETDTPPLPDDQKHAFHGGERAILYGVVEDLITTFGFNGKACMLRTICEVHSKSIHHLGLFGEMAKLFFT